MQWVEEEASEEAPGWYFGTVDSLTEDGNFLIIYADNATEVIILLRFSSKKSQNCYKISIQVPTGGGGGGG